MSVKIILAPYKDPAEGLDWHEQTPLIRKELHGILSNYPFGKVEYKIEETDHGIGADLPTILLEIIGIGSTLFFGVPALHKKIRETIGEWKKIWEEVKNFIKWINKKQPIISYSKEIAFLKALEFLETKVGDKILEIELYGLVEISGKSGKIEKKFETSPLLYHLFLFKYEEEYIYLVASNSLLEIVVDKKLTLDIRNL